MRAHEALGERAQALRAYRQFAERVRAEFGAEPAGPAAALHERLRGDG
jgi:DNA-binding SARP family transcriptional activator